MANVITLNTADHPTLTQLLVHTPLGLFDFKSQMSGGSVTVTDSRVKKDILQLINPATGKAWLKES